MLVVDTLACSRFPGQQATDPWAREEKAHACDEWVDDARRSEVVVLDVDAFLPC